MRRAPCGRRANVRDLRRFAHGRAVLPVIKALHQGDERIRKAVAEREQLRFDALAADGGVQHVVFLLVPPEAAVFADDLEREAVPPAMRDFRQQNGPDRAVLVPKRQARGILAVHMERRPGPTRRAIHRPVRDRAIREEAHKRGRDGQHALARDVLRRVDPMAADLGDRAHIPGERGPVPPIVRRGQDVKILLIAAVDQQRPPERAAADQLPRALHGHMVPHVEGHGAAAAALRGKRGQRPRLGRAQAERLFAEHVLLRHEREAYELPVRGGWRADMHRVDVWPERERRIGPPRRNAPLRGKRLRGLRPRRHDDRRFDPAGFQRCGVQARRESASDDGCFFAHGCLLPVPLVPIL